MRNGRRIEPARSILAGALALLALACGPERETRAEAPPVEAARAATKDSAAAQAAPSSTRAAAAAPPAQASPAATPAPKSTAETATNTATPVAAAAPAATPVAPPAATPVASPPPTAGEAPATATAAEVPPPAPDYPMDAPSYPNAAVSETATASDGRVRQVSTSTDSGEQVYAHMLDALEAHGWEVQSKVAQDGQFALDATKTDRRSAVLIADRDVIENGDGTTRITVLVTP